MSDWERMGRVAGAALLRAEAAAVAAIRAAVRNSTDVVAGRLAMIPHGPRGTVAESAIRIVRDEMQPLGTAVAQAVRNARMGAKAASASRLESEWYAVYRELEASGYDAPAQLTPQPMAAPEDDTEAEIAGQSYATAWGAGMMAAIWRWTERGSGSLATAAAETTKVLDYRVRRIATTETTKAFADARDEGMGWVAEHHKDARWFPLLLKVWDATLDRKVCPTCSELDGTTRPWGLPFPGHAEPGYVHAHCRCVTATRLLPIPARETVPGRQVDDERPRPATG